MARLVSWAVAESAFREGLAGWAGPAAGPDLRPPCARPSRPGRPRGPGPGRGVTAAQGALPQPAARHRAPSPWLWGAPTWGLGWQRPSAAFPQGTLRPVHADRELTPHGPQGWQGPARLWRNLHGGSAENCRCSQPAVGGRAGGPGRGARMGGLHEVTPHRGLQALRAWSWGAGSQVGRAACCLEVCPRGSSGRQVRSRGVQPWRPCTWSLGPSAGSPAGGSVSSCGKASAPSPGRCELRRGAVWEQAGRSPPRAGGRQAGPSEPSPRGAARPPAVARTPGAVLGGPFCHEAQGRP